MTTRTAPSPWHGVAAQVLAMGIRTVLVVGAGDVGKSTFARWLVGHLLGEGRRVDLIDCDLGQKTVGPPTAVTRGHATLAGDRAAFALTGLHFVGRTHPIGVTAHVLAGLARLHAEAAAAADMVVVDTCGLVVGAGLDLKQAMVDLVAPDLLCAIDRAGELVPLLQGNRHRPIVRLEPAAAVRPKSSSERRAARAAALADHLSPGVPVTLAIDAIAFQRSPLFVGTPVTIDGTVYAERIGATVVAVCPAAAPAPAGARRLRCDFARSLLCGLAAGDGRGLALGRIDAIDFRRRTLTLWTPAPAEAIRALRFGDLYVDGDGTEIGRADFAGSLPG